MAKPTPQISNLTRVDQSVAVPAPAVGLKLFAVATWQRRISVLADLFASLVIRFFCSMRKMLKMQVYRRLVALGLAVVLGCLSGCGDGLKRVPITGLLTVKGEPLSGASVQFFPVGTTAGEGAMGVSDTAGKFEVISSRDRDKGVPPGKYKVRVSLMMDGKGKILPPDALQADYPDAREAVPAPFCTPNSTIEVEIPEAGGEVKVDIPAALRKK